MGKPAQKPWCGKGIGMKKETCGNCRLNLQCMQSHFGCCGLQFGCPWNMLDGGWCCYVLFGVDVGELDVVGTCCMLFGVVGLFGTFGCCWVLLGAV